MQKYYVSADVVRDMTAEEREAVGGLNGLMLAGRMKAMVEADSVPEAIRRGKICISGCLRDGLEVRNAGCSTVGRWDNSIYANMDTATWLCYYRKAAGMTQQQLADASGVNIRQIQRVENGEGDIANVTAQNLIAIADALKVEPRVLLAGGDV